MPRRVDAPRAALFAHADGVEVRYLANLSNRLAYHHQPSAVA
jgi:hypothetical protein